jgi:hypothetical protein
LQFVDGANSGGRPIAVAFVLQEDQIVQAGEVLEVTLTDILLQPFEAGRPAAPDFGIDLGDVEDVDVDAGFAEQIGSADTAAALIVVAGNDFRRFDGEFGDALQNVFGVAGLKIGDELCRWSG